jgi:hypothetical protein
MIKEYVGRKGLWRLARVAATGARVSVRLLDDYFAVAFMAEHFRQPFGRHKVFRPGYPEVPPIVLTFDVVRHPSLA